MEKLPAFLTHSLSETDPEIYTLIMDEHKRQRTGLELIASENFTSVSVRECLGSCLTNKYSEGQPGKRYYGGNEYIDKIELLCQKRALKAFNLDETTWGVNVQPYSGSPANFAVYTGLLKPHDRIMGLNLPDGGHLTHGFMSKTKRVSATSIFWESIPYRINPLTGLIDYDELQKLAFSILPKLIIAGFSCYPRHLNYARFKTVADSVGALLMADISHISGLVSSGLSPNPFLYAHVVTTTAHKVLRGPRTGLIFYRKDKGPNHSDLENKINSAVFPGLQGGPHNNVIAGLATALKQVDTEEYKTYAGLVIENCKAMQKRFKELNYDMTTGGSDNHLILIDLKNIRMNGAIAEKALELVNIIVNKNACPGDTNMLKPSGIRIGTPALTTRCFHPTDMIKVVDYIHECLSLTSQLISREEITLANFNKLCEKQDVIDKYKTLKESIENFSNQFPFP